MDALLRPAGAVAALGAALIAIAVGAAAPLWAAASWLALLVLAGGAAQLAVAVLALRGRRLRAGAVALALGTPTLAWLAGLVAGGAASAVPLVPMLAGSALALGASLALCRPSRRASHEAQHARAEPRPLAALGVLAAASAVVATVTTGALAGTEAGAFAQPHGAHGAGTAELAGLDIAEHAGH
ncbi:hypothetical protein [Agrococcus carbonis]|uniref:Uncharacterized protein n=1 Tax=Agrococcus carbonis TaxID=684552 RepID=A0A1H1L6J5_9MICO|nr:hypothetical protein [Agrococcus carbonis]SDR70027.1 hypothetical protein SAMN04489719_0442 [Agrococcus carbonis]